MKKNKNRSKAKKPRSFLSFIITSYVLIAIGFVALAFFVGYENSSKTVLSIDRNHNDFLKTNYSVDISVSKQWISEGMVGAQYDGIIYNHSGHDISDWTIELTTPYGSRLDSDWNGVYDMSGDGHTLIIEPLDYNNIVVPGGSQTFGMIMYTDTEFTPWKMTVSFSTAKTITEYVFFYVLIGLSVIAVIVTAAFVISNIRIAAYRKRQLQYKKIIDETLDAFANVIDAKDEYTNGHSARVAYYARELARRMGMSEQEQENIRIIALLHDIGKVGIPDAILNKPGVLSDEEREIIRTHTTVGNKILSNFTSVENIAEGSHYHHERIDGKGYPDGLSGDEIPLCARIICVADSYDAMSSSRCYRKMLSNEEIIEELRNCSGSQFDSSIVPYMISMIEDKTAPIVFEGDN